jgi:hypothetical protein
MLFIKTINTTNKPLLLWRYIPQQMERLLICAHIEAGRLIFTLLGLGIAVAATVKPMFITPPTKRAG